MQVTVIDHVDGEGGDEARVRTVNVNPRAKRFTLTTIWMPNQQILMRWTTMCGTNVLPAVAVVGVLVAAVEVGKIEKPERIVHVGRPQQRTTIQ